VPVDARLRAAVDGALAWYVDLYAAHGVPAELSDGVFAALAPAPPLHSSVITVEPDVPGDLLRRRVAAAPDSGVADNFHDQDLGDAGLSLLFSATWLHRPATASTLPPGWSRVTSAGGLAAWNAAGDTDGVVLPGLVGRATFAVLEHRDADGITAGCIASLGTGAVYLSNVHAAPGHDCDWEQVVDAASATYPGRPLVGYEHGDDLAAARAVGFDEVGAKRVWVGTTPA
jgi:hypothetical protein